MISHRRAALYAFLPVPFVYQADQWLKGQTGGLGLSWHQHFIERPLWLIVTALFLGMAAVIYCRSRLLSFGFALMTGGALANADDMAKDGFAWNMFPLPYSDIFFNLADCFLVAGFLMAICSLGKLLFSKEVQLA